MSYPKKNAAQSPIWRLPHTAAYLKRVGAFPRALRKAVILETVNGYPRQREVIAFEIGTDNHWTVKTSQPYAPSEMELAGIKSELAGVEWPRWIPASGPFRKSQLPEPYRSLPDDHIFILRGPFPEDGIVDDLANSRQDPADAFPVLMVQARVEPKNGAKKFYMPLTYWNDDEWRTEEPERPLPVFGLEQLAETDRSCAFIHEGAKAARGARSIAEAFLKEPSVRSKHENDLAVHPWASDLAEGVHLGWIGGTHRADATHWLELRAALKRAQISKVTLVGDNDPGGQAVLPRLSKNLDLPVQHLIFTGAFPYSFDLADKFPPGAPAMDECLLPGTWMTRSIKNKRGKPSVVLTEAGESEWTYIPEPMLYVNVRRPFIAYDKERLNALLRPLSHSGNVAQLIEKAPYHSGRPMRLAYHPGKPQGVISDGQSTALNQHRPSLIRAQKGPASLFLEYLAYLIPNHRDRLELERWCATLIARPSLRMVYSVLLISEAQGVGKSTLGYILAELVGRHNASFPSESSIGSEFNEWIFEKRLAVINEVYAGHSWKGYNALKEAVTEETVELNQKYARKLTVGNWVHIIACSNSRRALKLAGEDRRWFVPEVTEQPWPREKFAQLRQWLNDGGLGEIKHWATQFDESYYVKAGAHAPPSAAKDEVIAAGWSDAAKAVVLMAEKMTTMTEPSIVTVRSVRAFIQAQLKPARVNETDQEIASLLKRHGLAKLGRLKVSGVLETVLGNPIAVEFIERIEPGSVRHAEIIGLIREPI